MTTDTDTDTVARHCIEAFIAAVHAGDPEAAREQLAPAYELVFPGPASFHDVDSIFSWFAKRYASARYSYGQMDFVAHADRTVVYATGSVEGALLDGVHFSDVRFIDRFEIVQGKIARKEVWSDMSDLLRMMGR